MDFNKLFEWIALYEEPKGLSVLLSCLSLSLNAHEIIFEKDKFSGYFRTALQSKYAVGMFTVVTSG